MKLSASENAQCATVFLRSAEQAVVDGLSAVELDDFPGGVVDLLLAQAFALGLGESQVRMALFDAPFMDANPGARLSVDIRWADHEIIVELAAEDWPSETHETLYAARRVVLA